jgi:hypothetical protein
MRQRRRREITVDKERVTRLVGLKVAVGLRSEEAVGSVEIVATLEEVRDDGIVLSEISEFGPGPKIFCPWDSLNRIRGRPYWMWMSHEEPEPGEAAQGREYYDLREFVAKEAAPEPPVELPRISARNLERVVSIAQRRTIGEVTVALTSLELFGGGIGVLRYRISYEEGMFEGGYHIPEPELIIRDGSGCVLPWSPRGNGSSESEAYGEVEVRDLPEAGELEVEVTRLVTLEFAQEAGEEVVEDSFEGPWVFRFVI